MTLVQPPVFRDGNPELAQHVERDTERADRARQYRGERGVELKASVVQQAARFARFLATALRQVDVGPAGEAVLLVPGRLAVAKQNEFMHKAGRRFSQRNARSRRALLRS